MPKTDHLTHEEKAKEVERLRAELKVPESVGEHHGESGGLEDGTDTVLDEKTGELLPAHKAVDVAEINAGVCPEKNAGKFSLYTWISCCAELC